MVMAATSSTLSFGGQPLDVAVTAASSDTEPVFKEMQDAMGLNERTVKYCIDKVCMTTQGDFFGVISQREKIVKHVPTTDGLSFLIVKMGRLAKAIERIQKAADVWAERMKRGDEEVDADIPLPKEDMRAWKAFPVRRCNTSHPTEVAPSETIDIQVAKEIKASAPQVNKTWEIIALMLRPMPNTSGSRSQMIQMA